jgi:hypothetical protein
MEETDAALDDQRTDASDTGRTLRSGDAIEDAVQNFEAGSLEIGTR